MANRRIIDLEDSNQLDLNDYVALYNSEPTSDHATYKRKISDVLGLKTVSVNGKTGNTITVNADDISDSTTAKKFVTTSEKNKISLIRTDQGNNTFLAGDGSYRTIGSITPSFKEVFMFNYLFQFPNRKYSLWNSEGSLTANIQTGTTVSGNTRFYWTVSNPDYIIPNSVKIYDVNNDTYLASGIIVNNKSVNSGEVYVILSPIIYNTIQSHSWKIEFTSVDGVVIQSNNLTFNWV